MRAHLDGLAAAAVDCVAGEAPGYRRVPDGARRVGGRAAGKTPLVLDTVTADDAEWLYDRLGWTRVGVIPDYALYPDGRLCDTTVFHKRL